MKNRHLVIVIANVSGMPLAILAAQCVSTAMPLVPAAIIGGGICGWAGYSLCKSLWKLIEN